MEPAMPGTLSYAEFAAAAEHFRCWWSARCGDQQQCWHWSCKIQPVTREEVGFLAMERVQQQTAVAPAEHDATGQIAAAAAAGSPRAADAQRESPQAANAQQGMPEAADAEQGSLDPCKQDSHVDEASLDLEDSHAAGVLVWEYHIVYHTSYQVPALCFRARTADGSTVSEAELFAQLPGMQSYKGSDTPDWAFITQMEHPVLHTPWLVLHPCQTAQLMSLLLSPDSASVTSDDAGKQQHHGTEVTPRGACADGAGSNASRTSSGNRSGGLAAAWLDRYMPAWFSLVAPVVGLAVQHQKLTFSGM